MEQEKNGPPEDVAGTEWESGGLREHDLVLLRFGEYDREKGSGLLEVSHRADGSSGVYRYSWDGRRGTTDPAYLTGGFTLNGETLMVMDFYGHGSPVIFTRRP
jgi:hypothetical protein